MQLRRRVQLIFLALALFAVADVGIDRYLVEQRDAHRRDVTQRWEPASEAVSQLVTGLVDQSTAGRSYVISGRQAALEEFALGGRTADAAIDDLRRLVGTDPAIELQVRRAEGRIGAWRQLGANFEIEAKRAGRDLQAIDLVATGTAERLFDETQVEASDLRRTILQRLAREEGIVQDAENRASALRIVSALAALALVAAGGVLMRRWLTHPLAEIAGSVQTVAGGDLDREIPRVGPPELANLATDVDAMRRRILEEVDEAERARSSLAQRGMIVLRLRDELAPTPVDPPPGLRVAARFRPAETLVAGDWYELSRDGDDLVFVVADVSGHGPNAGIFALKTKQLMRVALTETRSPAEAWAWVAEHLSGDDDQFVTGVIGSISTGEKTLTYCNAGHPPPILHNGTSTTMLAPTGPIVGAFAGVWTDEIVPFGPGCSMVAYSDGLLEVQDRAGGWADVGQLLADLRWELRPSVERLADLCLAFHDRYDLREHHDDLTVLAIAAVD